MQNDALEIAAADLLLTTVDLKYEEKKGLASDTAEWTCGLQIGERLFWTSSATIKRAPEGTRLREVVSAVEHFWHKFILVAQEFSKIQEGSPLKKLTQEEQERFMLKYEILTEELCDSLSANAAALWPPGKSPRSSPFALFSLPALCGTRQATIDTTADDPTSDPSHLIRSP